MRYCGTSKTSSLLFYFEKALRGIEITVLHLSVCRASMGRTHFFLFYSIPTTVQGHDLAELWSTTDDFAALSACGVGGGRSTNFDESRARACCACLAKSVPIHPFIFPFCPFCLSHDCALKNRI